MKVYKMMTKRATWKNGWIGANWVVEDAIEEYMKMMNTASDYPLDGKVLYNTAETIDENGHTKLHTYTKNGFMDVMVA